MSKRAISRLLQIANNLSMDAKRIVDANDLPQDTALKLSQLPHNQQAEAASLLVARKVQSVDNGCSGKYAGWPVVLQSAVEDVSHVTEKRWNPHAQRASSPHRPDNRHLYPAPDRHRGEGNQGFHGIWPCGSSDGWCFLHG